MAGNTNPNYELTYGSGSNSSGADGSFWKEAGAAVRSFLGSLFSRTDVSYGPEGVRASYGSPQGPAQQDNSRLVVITVVFGIVLVLVTVVFAFIKRK